MIFLIVSDKQAFRRTHIEASIPIGSEVLVHDDIAIPDLEQYLYPSLFSTTAPVIHLKFILTESTTLPPMFLQTLLASPTIFIFEEMTVAPTVVGLFKKAGASIHLGDKPESQKKDGNMFAVTAALTAPDKKRRWLAYRSALEHYSVEAIMGILYWKVRDLAAKNPKQRAAYLALYRTLLESHARAWETGAPLEQMIEKVILSV